MQTVVDYLIEKGEEVSDLENIIAEMELLADEAENVDLTQDNEALIDLYINIKQDSIGLVGDFREATQELLDEEGRTELRSRFQDAEREGLNDLRDAIEQRRREFHANVVRKLLNSMNEQDDKLLEKIRGGEISSAEIRAELKIKVREKAEEQVEELKEKLQEEAQQRKLEIKENIKDYSDARVTEAQARIQVRSNRLRAALGGRQ